MIEPKKISKIFSSFWPLQIGGWLVYLVMIYITFLTVAAPENYFRLFEIKGFRTIVGFLITVILWRIYRRLTGQSLSYQIITALAASVLFGIVWAAFEIYFFYLTDASYNLNAGIARSPRTSLDYAMTLTAWSALYFGIKNWQKWQAEKENSLEAQALANRAQLEALRYQLDPHFLFNALNSIRASIDEDKNRAKQMVTEFSEFLRYSLVNSDNSMIPLRDEIEAIRNYLSIEQIRFEEKLKVNIETEKEAEDFVIPSFLIHPLIENAIKHGRANGDGALILKIEAKTENGNLNVTVENSGRLEAYDTNGTHVGLKNIRERLKRVFAERSDFQISQQDGMVRAVIKIRK